MCPSLAIVPSIGSDTQSMQKYRHPGFDIYRPLSAATLHLTSRFHQTTYPIKAPDFPSSVFPRSEGAAPPPHYGGDPSSHARSPMHVPLAHRAIQPACTPPLTRTFFLTNVSEKEKETQARVRAAELTQNKKPVQYHSTMEAMVGMDYQAPSFRIADVSQTGDSSSCGRCRWFLHVSCKICMTEDGNADSVHLIDLDTGKVVCGQLVKPPSQSSTISPGKFASDLSFSRT
ncbi:hypothetical protein EDB84DRAFT_415730 [Lactarius hengduanensis]|nr:hypothetical protein EDB84DRAFT_415730 [Lactarius hengduanensis]